MKVALDALQTSNTLSWFPLLSIRGLELLAQYYKYQP